jgi:hypothetical protein
MALTGKFKLYLIITLVVVVILVLGFFILRGNTRTITLSGGYVVTYTGKLDGNEAAKLLTYCQEVLYPAAAKDKVAREQLDEALTLIIKDQGSYADDALLLRSKVYLYSSEVEKALDDLVAISREYGEGDIVKDGTLNEYLMGFIGSYVGSKGKRPAAIPLYQVLRAEHILKEAGSPLDAQARGVIDDLLNDSQLLAGISATTMGTPDNTRTSDITAKEDAATQARFNALEKLPADIAGQISARIELSNILPNGQDELINWVRDHIDIKVGEVKSEAAKPNEPKPGEQITPPQEPKPAPPAAEKPKTPEELANDKLKTQFDTRDETKFLATAQAVATLKGKNLTLGELLRQCEISDVYNLVKER